MTRKVAPSHRTHATHLAEYHQTTMSMTSRCEVMIKFNHHPDIRYSLDILISPHYPTMFVDVRSFNHMTNHHHVSKAIVNCEQMNPCSGYPWCYSSLVLLTEPIKTWSSTAHYFHLAMGSWARWRPNTFTGANIQCMHLHCHFVPFSNLNHLL